MPVVAGNWVAWWDLTSVRYSKVVEKNIKTGKRVVFKQRAPGIVGPPGVGGGRIYWFKDSGADGDGVLRRAPLGRRRYRAIAGPGGPGAPTWFGAGGLPPVPSANRLHVAYTDETNLLDPSTPAGVGDGRDVFLARPGGSATPKPVTRNRGDQAYPVMGWGNRVLWLDAARGHTDLVTNLP